MRTAIKQDLSPDLKSLNRAIFGVLENKANASSRTIIGSLKTAIKEKIE